MVENLQKKSYLKNEPLHGDKFLFLIFLVWGLFCLYGLRFWEGSPWLFKICYVIMVISTVYLTCRMLLNVHKNQQLLKTILPELEAGDLFPSDVDYFDEVLQIFVYDHYLIGCGQADCVDIYDIKVVKVPHPKRDRHRDGIWGYLNSGEGFEIRSIGASSKTRLYQIANYLHDHFDIPIEMYH